MLVVKLFTDNETPLIMFPMSIPQIGITYCGFQMGVGRMMKKKAKDPTVVMVMRSVRKVRRG